MALVQLTWKAYNTVWTTGVGITALQEFFCDGNPGDCKDGSDETACTVNEDPNAAPKCDLSQCVLPDCFCSADGTKIPGRWERCPSVCRR